jgi:hypothetical protein
MCITPFLYSSLSFSRFFLGGPGCLATLLRRLPMPSPGAEIMPSVVPNASMDGKGNLGSTRDWCYLGGAVLLGFAEVDQWNHGHRLSSERGE